MAAIEPLWRRRATIAPGQSNEGGAGPTGTAGWSTAGCPLRDPVRPNGAAVASLYPRLATRFGNDNKWLDFHNGAVGATSIVRNWVGQIQAYAVNTNFAVGDRVVQSGRVYRVSASTNPTVSTSGLSGSTAPTWPASGTVVDNHLTWVYERVSTAADVVGRIFRPGEVGFDPNGYFAAARNGLLGVPGYSEYWAFVSIGQGDRSFLTPAADFQLAYEVSCDYWRSQGVKVALGFTCYNGAPGADAHMQVLNTAAKAAMATRVDGVNVIRGSNAYDAFGASLPRHDSPPIHASRDGLIMWADDWYAKLTESGVW